MEETQEILGETTTVLTTNSLARRQARIKELGKLLELNSEEDIVDAIICYRLTPEVHKISRLLNRALR